MDAIDSAYVNHVIAMLQCWLRNPDQPTALSGKLVWSHWSFLRIEFMMRECSDERLKNVKKFMDKKNIKYVIEHSPSEVCTVRAHRQKKTCIVS